jgi:uncharacterized membrane-anchored protein
MSWRIEYWIRILITSIVATAINVVVDQALKIPVGSAHDWLLFFAILGVLSYFFCWRFYHRHLSQERNNG